MEGADPQTPACGMTVWNQFVANPTAALDTSCTANTRKHHFEESPSIAQYMYGRPSLWSAAPKIGTPNGPPPLAYATTKAIENELRRAERDTRMLRLGQRLQRARDVSAP